MRLLETVDAEGHALQPDRLDGAGDVVVPQDPVRDHSGGDPEIDELLGDQRPVPPQQRLPPRERHEPALELRELLGELERFGERELVGARRTGTRSTVTAAEVAAEGELPHADPGIESELPEQFDHRRITMDRWHSCAIRGRGWQSALQVPHQQLPDNAGSNRA